MTAPEPRLQSISEHTSDNPAPVSSQSCLQSASEHRAPISSRFSSGITRRTFVVGAAVFAATLVGCDSSLTDLVSSEEEGESAENVDAAAVAEQNGIASVLPAVVAYAGETPNPIGAASDLFVAAGWHVFEGLYEINFHTYQAEKGLAVEDPVKVSDGVYDISLRQDAVFSDGTPLTATDVCNAFQRNMKDDLYCSLLSFIEDISVKDTTTVRLTTSAPFETLMLERLALVRIFPAGLGDEQLNTLPIGSGPWCYESINAADGGVLSFTANTQYAGNYPATCERMEWTIQLDSEKRTELLQNNQVICAQDPKIDDEKKLTDAGIKVSYVPGFNAPFLMFNCLHTHFKEVAVRQALMYAIDVDSLIGNVMGGHAHAATSLLPDYFRHYHRASTVYSYDQAKAQKLLHEAGVKTLAVKLRVGDTWVKLLVDGIVSNWKEIGVTTEVQAFDEAQLMADISEPPASGKTLPFEVVLTSGDPTHFGNDADLLLHWWYGNNVWTQARTCWDQSAEFKELAQILTKSRSTSDENEQQNLWNQAYDIVAEQVPLYPLFHSDVLTAYREDELDGYDPISAMGLDFLGATPLQDIK